MKKNVLYCVLIALASITIIGCGGSNNPDLQNQEPFSVSKYQSLKQESNITDISDDDSIDTATQDSNGDVATSPSQIICNSGSITITGTNVNADNCVNTGLSLNGEGIYSNVENGNEESVLLKATTDVVLENSQNKLTFQQNSYFETNSTTINDNNSTVNIRVDARGSLNDVAFAFDIDLKIDIYDCTSNFSECTDTSITNVNNANITLGDYSFILDTAHSNIITTSTPPMSDDVITGNIQWIEAGSNHDIQLSFEDDNKTYLKVDENGNNTFESTEITEL